MSELYWWGYTHQNGTFHVKRYWNEIDLMEAHESPFVNQVMGPIKAETKSEAAKLLKESLQKTINSFAPFK